MVQWILDCQKKKILYITKIIFIKLKWDIQKQSFPILPLIAKENDVDIRIKLLALKCHYECITERGEKKVQLRIKKILYNTAGLNIFKSLITGFTAPFK